MDRFDQSSISLVEGDFVYSVKQLFEVVLHHLRVRSERENLEKIRIRAEVETREDTSLLF